MKNIYILREGREFGPFPLSEVFAKLKDGTLVPHDQARREEDTEWKALDQVVKAGSSTFFSVDQLDQIRAEEPPAPVIVPDFQPLRPSHEADLVERKRGTSVVLISATLLLMFAGIGVIRWWTPEFPGDSTISASPTPPSVLVARQSVPSAPPAMENQAVAISSPSQPIPEATHSPTAPTSQTAAAIEPSPTRLTPSAGPFTEGSRPVISADLSVKTTPPRSVQPLENQQPPQFSSTTQPLSDAGHSTEPPAVQPSPAPTASTIVPPVAAPQQTVASNPPATPTPSLLAQPVFVSDLFKIESLQLQKKVPKSKIGVWHLDGPRGKSPPQFLQCLEVKVSARENTRSDQTFAKAYFFDNKHKQIASREKPSPSGKPTGKQFEMPVLFYKDKPDSVFFEIPKEVSSANLKAVVVFGDKYEAHAACLPCSENDSVVDYPEKHLVHNPTKRIARKPAMDPLIQYEVKTKNPRQPKITLFLRPPKGVSSAEEVKGVLSLCILAGGIEDIKRALQKEEMDGDYNGLLGFANTHKLAILAWGSSGLWNPGANFEDLPKEQAKAMDKSFDLVANGWERGVHELGEKYGIPQKDFLLWGSCGSAQWAHRLCLRKPDYFLAINIHIPGSFDKPTPEASKVIWCLTTGELYGGYERSLRFVAACRKLGYPMVYKAIVGLGHAGHRDATAMGFKFFEFALNQKAARDEYDKKMASALERERMIQNASKPWPDLFRSPPFYGDIVNQEMYPSDQVAMIPEGFRIPLPTKEIADIWARSH